MTYKNTKNLAESEVINLYEDAGWTAYTKEPQRLIQAINNSLEVLTAWENERLIGLIRVVGDGLTIVYIQDILVLKSYQRQGIGRALMTRMLEKYKEVRQKVLLTDDSPTVREFYESLGFQSCDKGNLVAFARLENLV